MHCATGRDRHTEMWGSGAGGRDVMTSQGRKCKKEPVWGATGEDGQKDVTVCGIWASAWIAGMRHDGEGGGSGEGEGDKRL